MGSSYTRHGDFENLCPDKDKKWDCFAPLSAFDQRVKEIQHELQHRPGNKYKDANGVFQPLPVIMTSDERDPDWWKRVADLGVEVYRSWARWRGHGE